MKRVVIVLVGLLMMFGLFGCGSKKYNVIFDEYGFESKKNTYAAGQKVRVTYDFLATDTDYHFYLAPEDGTQLKTEHKNDKMILTFKMPAHDVHVCVDSVNSMHMPAVVAELENRVLPGDLWIMTDTPENRKKSTWGGTTVKACPVNEPMSLAFEEVSKENKYIVRMIDENGMYYEVSAVEIVDGQRIVIQSGDADMTAVVCIYDAEGNLAGEYEMFVGRL